MIKIRSSGVQKHWREREGVFQNGPVSPRRLTRKRYIDLGNERTQQHSQVHSVTWTGVSVISAAEEERFSYRRASSRL